MARIKSSLLNMFLSLTLICVIAAALLAWVNNMTKEPIAAAEKAKQENAIKAVTPAFDNNPTQDQTEVEISGGDKFIVFPAKRDGKLVGAAVQSFTKKGFGGTVKIMFGFDTDNKIVNYSVLEHAETPGLGAKMQDWFSDKSKPSRSVIGKVANGSMKVKKDGGDVDAITAATISSRAFMDAINRATEAFEIFKKNNSGSVAENANIGGQENE